MPPVTGKRKKINNMIFIRILIILAIQIFFMEYSFRNIGPLDISTTYLVTILSFLGFVSCLLVFQAGRSGFSSYLYNFALVIFDTVYIAVLFTGTGGIYSPFTLLLPVYIISSSFLAGGPGNLISVIVSVAMIFADYILFKNKNFVFSTSIVTMLIIFGLVTRYFLSNLLKDIEENKKIEIVAPIASVLAHEIKNPVASLRGAVDMLAYDLKNEDREKLFALIRRETDRLVHLAEDFLAFSSPDKRTDSVVDMNLLINQICESLKMHGDFKFKNLGINLNLTGNVFVRGDFNRLSQVVENIMINAMHATEPGSSISCSLKEEGGKVVIAISDAGKGIAENIIDKVFNPFFTTKQKGTGLGLAIARRIVEAHNGAISVRNINPGAEFRIVLPRLV
jgi:signal transduction histidine kinase